MGVNGTIRILLAGLLAVLAVAQSCDKLDQPAVLPEVCVLFSPDGLGDMSYNDVILRGLELVMNDEEKDFYISFMSPTGYDMAEELIQGWWDERDYTYAEDGTVPRKLLVLADAEYAVIARKIITPELIDKDLSIIAFETDAPAQASDPLHTFDISLYGASWLAGRTAREMGCTRPLVLMGDSSNEFTYDGRDGFIAGFQGDVPVDAVANDWQGYCMPLEVYQMMYSFDGKYDFIYSISGGTNMGIYRYLRENPDCGIYTAGMDVDQSPYSTLIVGSMVKRIDLVVHDYLKNWLDEAELPVHQDFGLESGFVDWVIPDRYSNIRPAIAALRQEAIAKEKAYGKAGE